MDDAARREAGMGVRRKVLGDAHVDRAVAKLNPVNTEFQDLITRYAWGEIWTRPGLDMRTRRVLVIGTLLALGRWEEFEMHVRAALEEGGVPVEHIKEIVLQQSIYCGVPAAHAALIRVEGILAVATSPQPRRGAFKAKKGR